MSRDAEIFLFRHAEALNNLQVNVVGGRSETSPLVANGIVQARQLGFVLREKGLIPDVAFSSGAVRARQTGENTLQAMGLEVDILEDERLHEQDVGEWTGGVATEIFTDDTIQDIEASGKDFRSPGGESMNDVGERMFEWLESTTDLDADTIFAFTHGGAIRSLASYIYGWSHDKTYKTQPAHTSATTLRKVDGLWRIENLGIEAAELEGQFITPNEISFRLSENEVVKKHLESVVWFGSIRNKQDVHASSDYDLQIVLDEPNDELTLELNGILKDYTNVDLSVMYMKDIYDRNGNIIFHDGTKGPFFMYVLAAGKVLYGRNIYEEAVDGLTLADSQPSILLTVREYLSRLRVMAAQSPEDTLRFKKYSLKMFKDLLLYDGTVPLEDMSKVDNAVTCEKIMQRHRFSDHSQRALTSITDYRRGFTQPEMSALLYDYERIVEGICNE